MLFNASDSGPRNASSLPASGTALTATPYITYPLLWVHTCLPRPLPAGRTAHSARRPRLRCRLSAERTI